MDRKVARNPLLHIASTVRGYFRMTQQQYIENEFLTIEPSDNERLANFYSKHFKYFNCEPSLNMDSYEKYLTMICEIGNSFSFSGRHKEALKILKKAENIYRTINEDKNSNFIFNSILFCMANSNFALGNYLKAMTYFKIYMPTEKEKNNIDLLIQNCKDKIKNKILNVIGIFGVLIFIITFSVKWFSPDNYSIFFKYGGFISGILLLTYGISGIILRKKNNP